MSEEKLHHNTKVTNIYMYHLKNKDTYVRQHGQLGQHFQMRKRNEKREMTHALKKMLSKL